MSESKEPIFTPIVHSESPIKIPAALEGTVFQVGVTLEGRDDDDLQDASLTMEELQPARHPHKLPRVSEFVPI